MRWAEGHYQFNVQAIAMNFNLALPIGKVVDYGRRIRCALAERGARGQEA